MRKIGTMAAAFLVISGFAMAGDYQGGKTSLEADSFRVQVAADAEWWCLPKVTYFRAALNDSASAVLPSDGTKVGAGLRGGVCYGITDCHALHVGANYASVSHRKEGSITAATGLPSLDPSAFGSAASAAVREVFVQTNYCRWGVDLLLSSNWDLIDDVQIMTCVGGTYTRLDSSVAFNPFNIGSVLDTVDTDFFGGVLGIKAAIELDSELSLCANFRSDLCYADASLRAKDDSQTVRDSRSGFSAILGGGVGLHYTVENAGACLRGFVDHITDLSVVKHSFVNKTKLSDDCLTRFGVEVAANGTF